MGSMDLRDLPTDAAVNSADDSWDGEGRTTVGLVPLGGRGSLPFLLLHGESLVAAASWALGDTGARLLDLGTTWEAVAAMQADLVVHDPLCPGTPAAFLRAVLEEAVRHGEVAVGVRPVTDTVRTVAGGSAAGPSGEQAQRLGETVERSELVAVTSPVVVPADVLAGLEAPPSSSGDLGEIGDLADVVAWLAERVPVRHVAAPATSRRVVDASDVQLLEALSDQDS